LFLDWCPSISPVAAGSPRSPDGITPAPLPHNNEILMTRPARFCKHFLARFNILAGQCPLASANAS